MNKVGIIGAAAAVALIAYPASTWWTGQQIEARLAAQYETLDEVPFIRVENRDFQRGLFRSTERVTLELFGDLFRAIANAQDEGGAPPGPALQPIRIVITNDIRHGPLAGSQLAAAVVDTEIAFEGDLQGAIARVLGKRKPLLAHTVFDFAGGGRARLSSPAFALNLPPGGSGPTEIAWEGFAGQVEFESDMRRYTLRAEAPRLEMGDGQGTRVGLVGLRLEADQRRVFADDPMLYAGTQRFTIAELNAGSKDSADAPIAVKDLAYEIDMPGNGEFLDVIARLKATKVLVGDASYGPARFEQSFRRLHARTIAKLYRSMMQAYVDAAAAGGRLDPGEAFAPLADLAIELLKHGPEFVIDRVSFTTAGGEALLKARVKLNDAGPADFELPVLLLPKLEAHAELSIPERMLADLGAGGQSQEARQFFAAQLDAFAEQGFLKREGGLLKSELALRNGALLLNGKPFGPPHRERTRAFE